MKIAVLGTGAVGTTVASKLVQLGHDVTLGSRSDRNENGLSWVKQAATPRATLATFERAARSAEMIFNATKGEIALDVLQLAGATNLENKILIDISNPLDFSRGMPPRLSVCNDSSLGEQIQATFPRAKVVKTLNTVTASLMVAPQSLSADSAVFLSGNDTTAKQTVERLVLREWFGWKQVIDLGDITTARGTEMYLSLWVRLWSAQKSANFNIAIIQGHDA